MNIKTVPISLVSTVSRTSCNSIYTKLDGLGYKKINTIDCSEFVREAACDSRVFIVPINNKWLSGLPPEILTFLKQIHHQPILGVLPSSSVARNSKALTYCNEILYWPCVEVEIDLRIERLAELLKTDFQPENESQMFDEFLSLNMIGNSPPFLHVLKQIKKISYFDAPVSIEGATGTGKELAARAIHYLSPRKDFPFIPVNCGAIPDTLIENELFGHEKGAYTDAKNSQQGIVGMANQGTIFFDEVEAFSPKGQVVLLRFLEDQLYKPLGSELSCKANIRIIAASNEKLSQLVELGLFRQDLFYRLNIVKIEMPSLSHRGKDIELLTEYFFNKFKLQYNQQDKFLHPDSYKWLRRYGWPGNVRELENLLHREFLLTDGPCIRLKKESDNRNERRKTYMDRRQKLFLKYNLTEAKTKIVSQFEKAYLTRLLNETNGNVATPLDFLMCPAY